MPRCDNDYSSELSAKMAVSPRADFLQARRRIAVPMLPRIASAPPVNTSTYRALVVDDETMVRNLVCRALARRGFDVFEAVNGRAALDLIRADEFGLVVSDVKMPDMGGIELLENLRRERPGLPVVLLSGDFELARGQSAADLGAFALIQKPFSIDQLQRTALRAIELREASDVRLGDGRRRVLTATK